MILEVTDMAKKLVAYFSAEGTTRKKAEIIAEAGNCQLYEIKPKVPYTKDDLNWMNKKSRSSIEMADKNERMAYLDAQLKTFPQTPLNVGYRGRIPIKYVEGGAHGDHWDTVAENFLKRPGKSLYKNDRGRSSRHSRTLYCIV